MCTCVVHTCHGLLVEVIGQLYGIYLLSTFIGLWRQSSVFRLDDTLTCCAASPAPQITHRRRRMNTPVILAEAGESLWVQDQHGLCSKPVSQQISCTQTELHSEFKVSLGYTARKSPNQRDHQTAIPSTREAEARGL